MRIQNLKAPEENPLPPIVSQVASAAERANPAPVEGDGPDSTDRQTVEIAYLKARIQHLELVIEMARSLMGSNHERLLRRLNEVPHEMVELSAKLRRFDPSAVR